MLNGKKICVVMPGYNAERTLRRTYEEIPKDLVDDVILVDDRSTDHTAQVARELGIHTIVHPVNRGYGGNQKTCYTEALSRNADIVIMLHPDYQYTPLLIPALASLLASGLYDVALASRILGNGALRGGMPRYKFLMNRILTLGQNILLGQKLSEYHTGYRAFTAEVLRTLPLEENGDDFVFDNQMLVQCFHFGFGIAEVTCPTRYEAESSSISFRRSCRYGLGVVKASWQYRLARMGLLRPKFLSKDGRRLATAKSSP